MTLNWHDILHANLLLELDDVTNTIQPHYKMQSSLVTLFLLATRPFKCKDQREQIIVVVRIQQEGNSAS